MERYMSKYIRSCLQKKWRQIVLDVTQFSSKRDGTKRIRDAIKMVLIQINCDQNLVRLDDNHMVVIRIW